MTQFWAILKFLASLPAWISKLRDLWETIVDSWNKAKQRKRNEEVINASVEAKETKDTSRLEKHFNPDGDDPADSSK